ncbi:hypothetical protein P43SY_007200 [Pythium insidiosum]|uniref:Uncharacterized protein n=1 Tax=Pythium insidiosum TaxID=114742 RepID=A0AAD5LGK3_PYTIN|nr:hypothetical protein P43SY_007200 [Pythium insidiosum]
MADETTRPGYRGKCLYKTGKCNNERALKTSGQPHNLCDEHRMRQNEHQRKLDAKNRTARIEKRTKGSATPDGSSAGSTDGEDPRSSAAAAAAAAMAAVAAAASANGGGRHRYSPYTKMRLSPTGAPNGTEDAAGANGVLLSGGMAPPMMQFHPMSNSLPTQSPSQMMGSPEMMQSGVVILPNGPQPPHMPYPMAMQDFDGIVVPLPSYLEGHERSEFRSRIYQKVLDFIAEECMRRFGAPMMASEVPAKTSSSPLTPADPHSIPIGPVPSAESSNSGHDNERRAPGDHHNSAENSQNNSNEAPTNPMGDPEQRREDWKRVETTETESEPSSPTAEPKGNDKKREANDAPASDAESGAEDDAELPPAKRVRASRPRVARKEV